MIKNHSNFVEKFCPHRYSRSLDIVLHAVMFSGSCYRELVALYLNWKKYQMLFFEQKILEDSMIEIQKEFHLSKEGNVLEMHLYPCVANHDNPNVESSSFPLCLFLHLKIRYSIGLHLNSGRIDSENSLNMHFYLSLNPLEI